MKLGLFSVIFVSLSILTSCVETIEIQSPVYSNNFSRLDLKGFENGKLFIWRNDTVAGYYHNEQVAVTLKDLPSHNYLKLSIELLIHDSWDGNADDGVSAPDFWYMGVGQDETYRTTFSNSPCQPTYCLYQSYPNTFFRQNRPKSGAIDVNLPGLCLFGSSSSYTSRYVVEQIVEHSFPEARIFMGANLRQTNSTNPVCDESWSIAGIKVGAIQTTNP
jgi:hypothetical protein